MLGKGIKRLLRAHKSGKKTDFDKLIENADSLYKKKNYLDALQNYQKALELVPRKKRNWFKVAECYYAIEDYKNAVPCYNRFLRYKSAITDVNPNAHDQAEIIAIKNREIAQKELDIIMASEEIENQKRIEMEKKVEKELLEREKEAIKARRIAQKVEFDENLKIKKDELILSGNYIFIEKFIIRFENRFELSDTINLQKLLKYKGTPLEIEYLNEIIKEELELQTLKKELQTLNKFKEILTINRPTTLEEYVENFYQVTEHNYKDKLPLFEKILQEDNIHFSPQQINSIIDEINKKEKIKRFEKELMASDEVGSPFISIEDIDNLDGFQFENFLKILFENMGYKVNQTPLSGDQGADLILEKFNEKTVVQAKRYHGSVNNKAVQEVVASISHYNANKGMVVTNSIFTSSAIELAKSNDIKLVDKIYLKKWLKTYPIEINKFKSLTSQIM